MPMPAEPSTIAPTVTPAGAIYYKGFEQGNFPDPPEWTTTNDANTSLVWEVTDEFSNSGVYSLRSPVLYNEEGTSAIATATFITDANWPSGQLRFSVLASIQMPLDNFQYFVDGEMRGQEMETSAEFEEMVLLGPGQHTIDFVYNFNPVGLPLNSLPPLEAFPDRVGAVFVDDVYFVPNGTPSTPTGSPILAGPAQSCPAALDRQEVIAEGTTMYYTLVPANPTGSDNGLLCARLEVQGERWVGFGISSDGMMIGSEAVIGRPEEGTVEKYRMDGNSRDGVVSMDEGRQTLTSTSLTQANGVTTLDFVKKLVEPGEIPILEMGENIFLYALGGSNEFGYHAERGSFVVDFDENAAPSPAAFDGSTSIAPTLIPDGAVYYKGFEQGNFPQDYPEWTTSNDGNVDLVWEPTTEEASSGVYSIRSPVLYNEEGTPSSAKATLATNPDWPSGQLLFSVLASIAMPLDNLQYIVDGEIRNQVIVTSSGFEETSIQLSPGQHTIDFVYNFNPTGAPLANLPPPGAFLDRIGAVFIDEVYFVPNVLRSPTRTILNPTISHIDDSTGIPTYIPTTLLPSYFPTVNPMPMGTSKRKGS